jgi:transcriptional regulator
MHEMTKPKVKSPIQKQVEALEEKGAILDRILSVAKTESGRITEDGKNLYHILRGAGLNKSEIARVLDVTPSALTKYE